MNIKMLGTAAAEAWPAIFCNCETCNRARAAGGKNLRSRSSILINDQCKIDFPPDSYYHMVKYNLDFSALSHIFFTHSHSDHLCASELDFMCAPYAHNLKNPPIKVYGNAAVMDKTKAVLAGSIARGAVPAELVELKPFESIAANNLTFTTVLASHQEGEDCLNYIVKSAEGKAFLYTPDSGFYCPETLEYLKSVRLNMLIAECTLGTQNYEPIGHMTLAGVLELREHLVKHGVLGSNDRTIITHFSHNIGLLHDELQEIAGEYGIEVAYDGMQIEL